MRLVLVIAVVAGGLGCQPFDDEAPPAAWPVVIEGDGEGAQLEVQPPDGDAFSITLGAATHVRVEHRPGMAPRAEVRGPHLTFVADATELDYHTEDELWLWQGRVRVGGDALVQRVHLRDDGRLGGTLTVESYGELEGLTFPPERLRPSSTAVDEPFVTSNEPPIRYAYAAADVLTLHAAPGDARSLRFTLTDHEYTVFGVLQTEGAWTEVQWQSPILELRAWAQTTDLHFLAEGEMRGMGFGRGIGCMGGRRKRAQTVRAVLPAGTSIHAQPGRGAWARVHTAVTVELAPNPDGWGRSWRCPISTARGRGRGSTLPPSIARLRG